MKYYSMFSGIGGFEYGIGQAENNRQIIQESRQQNIQSKRNITSNRYIYNETSCIGYSEIDKYATAIYRYHYPEHRNFGDATTLNTSELPDFDLLVAGFPCQSFSIAGKRKGFNDTRGTLFFEIARVLRDKRPRYFLLENVKGLLSHDNGQTFRTILGVLSDIGYRDIQWQVLNSKDFGVPQNRERVFITGHLGDRGGFQVFPLGEDNQECTRSQETKSGGRERIRLQDYSTALRAKESRSGTDTLIALTETRTEEAKRIRRKIKDRDFSPRRGKMLVPRKDTIGNCVTSGQSKEALLGNGTQIRRLTPTECERLQGFPDDWTKYGIDENGKHIEISDTQRYKVLGNAISTPVITAIMLGFNSE